MNKTGKNGAKAAGKPKTAETKKEIKAIESPVEKALRLGSEQAIANAIRDLIKRDELN